MRNEALVKRWEHASISAIIFHSHNKKWSLLIHYSWAKSIIYLNIIVVSHNDSKGQNWICQGSIFFSRSSPLLLRITQFRSPLPFCRIENTNASSYKSNSHPQIPTPIKHIVSLMDYYEILEHVVSFVMISSLFFKAMNTPETQSFYYLVKQRLWCPLKKMGI